MTTPAPPPELFAEWLAAAVRLFPVGPPGIIASYVADRAYSAGDEAGAQEERNACVEWLTGNGYPQAAADLMEARTPRTDREKALRLLETFGCAFVKLSAEQVALIRRVVEEGQP